MKSSSLDLLVVVALAGAGTLIVELSAVRLLAPWFGTSSGVWTNVIGVILLALACGYLAGARLSLRPGPRRWLGSCLVLSGLATAWLPALARPVAGWFLPSGIRLDQAAGLLTWGSLATSFLLFFPAAAVLGCIGPLAVEALQRERGGHAGDAGGRVLAASTLGSLAGTFATTHVALPKLGLNTTFLATGGGLLVLGLWQALVGARSEGGRRSSAGTVMLLACAVGTAGALFASRLSPPARTDGAVVLEARETAYQSVRVVEDEGAPVPRRLEVNESFDSFQSVWQPGLGLLPWGYYYNHFALPAAWSAAGAGPIESGPWNLCVLGLGAGTALRVLEGTLQSAGRELSATGIELDPGVVELAQQWLDLAASETGGKPGEGAVDTRILGGLDARAALRFDDRDYDQIVVDTYTNQVEIPPHLCTIEFFKEVRERLVEGGWVSVNVGGFDLDDPVVDAVARTVARAFEHKALALRVPFARNVIVFARRSAEPPLPGTASFQVDLARAVGAAALPGTWRLFEPETEGAVLTDDLNPIELLQRRSIEEAEQRLAGWQP